MKARKARDWIVLACVAASFGVSIMFIAQLVSFASPWMGLTLMFDVLGLSAIARPIFLSKLPAPMRGIRAWEANGAVYRALGVRAFGSLLRNTPLRYLNTLVYFKRTPDASVLLAQLESAEAAHVAAALVLVPYIILAHLHGWLVGAAVLWAFEIGFNFYPIMHLRLARAQVARIAARRGRS